MDRSNRLVTSQSFFSRFICGTRGFFYRVGSIVYLLFAIVVANDIPIYTRSTSTVARSKCFKSFFQSSALLLTVFGMVFAFTTAPHIKYIPNDDNSLETLWNEFISYKNHSTVAMDELKNCVAVNMTKLEDRVAVNMTKLEDRVAVNMSELKNHVTANMTKLENRVAVNMSELVNRVTVLSNELNNLKKSLDAIQRNTTRRIDHIEDLFGTLNQTINTTLKENFTTLNTSINLQNETISIIQNLISELEHNITELIEKFNETTVLLIKKEIDKFSADQIARFDFALESAGGHIIESSETHELLNIKIKFMGITLPLTVSKRLPSAVIQPEVLPGDCWCFKGAQGYIVIKLTNPSVVVDAVTVQHLPKQLSPNGTIASAIKTFTVKGMTAQDDKGIDLGSFEYRDNGTPIQTFDINNQSAQNFSIVRFDVESNHGNPDHTCIYRLRVHGTLQEK